MRITRCHVDIPLQSGKRLNLPEHAAVHLVRVLRLKVGDTCVLFNGDGHDYAARIVSVTKREVQVEIGEAQTIDNESPLRVVLIQGIARGEKMDLILQKATELGVDAFIPVNSERTEVRLDAERADKRLAHWRSVVSSGCEQCGRARVPEVTAPQPLITALGQLGEGGLRLTLDPDAAESISQLALNADTTVVLAVGPEGGWSPRDREMLRTSGFIGLRLGPRILRTETAGIAAIAALQSHFGDLK